MYLDIFAKRFRKTFFNSINFFICNGFPIRYS